MRTLVALVFLSVTLSPPFGEAEARAVEAGPDGLVFEVEVEVEASAQVVLVRGTSRSEELAPVALTELSPGRWGGIVEITVVEDILVGFELIHPDGGSAIVSELYRLTELGVDPAVFAAVEATTTSPVDVVDEEPEPTGGVGPSKAPIWLGIAAGSAALALLLVWWLGDRREDELHVLEEAPEDAEPEGGSPDSA